MSTSNFFSQLATRAPRHISSDTPLPGAEDDDLVEQLTRQILEKDPLGEVPWQDVGNSQSFSLSEGSAERTNDENEERGSGQSVKPQMPHEPAGFYFLPPGASTSCSGFYFLPEKTQGHALRPFEVQRVRQDFPLLQRKMNGKPLVWLDNAATSQKPYRVIEALGRFYSHDNSNVHRGAHTLANHATALYEAARAKVRHFIGAKQVSEIVFVRGATEGINLVAQTCGRTSVGAGDEILLTTLEHHSNIVPWQLLCQEKGARLRIVPLDDRGEVMLDEFEKLVGERTRLVAIAHVSNVLGTVLPVKRMTRLAHRYGARVLVDGAQAVPHFPVNVQDLDVDFYVFSGHKVFGPTGIGVLYGKQELLEEMPPWQGGGSMIEHVTFEKTTYSQTPYKFEAGTGHIAGAIGLGEAFDYLESIGFEAASRYEEELMAYAQHSLEAIPGLRLIGTAPGKVGVLSFVLEGKRSEEVGAFLDHEGIALRTGHHCAQPALSRFGLTNVVRPSLAFYNTLEEVDKLIAALRSYGKRS
ncbi:MAG TPA: cysteine desulfurase [Ktedonosporobacter sp.]|nr:cysteine desulfurase [Ktedonosporobacter sp.]